MYTDLGIGIFEEVFVLNLPFVSLTFKVSPRGELSFINIALLTIGSVVEFLDGAVEQAKKWGNITS